MICHDVASKGPSKESYVGDLVPHYNSDPHNPRSRAQIPLARLAVLDPLSESEPSQSVGQFVVTGGHVPDVSASPIPEWHAFIEFCLT